MFLCATPSHKQISERSQVPTMWRPPPENWKRPRIITGQYLCAAASARARKDVSAVESVLFSSGNCFAKLILVLVRCSNVQCNSQPFCVLFFVFILYGVHCSKPRGSSTLSAETIACLLIPLESTRCGSNGSANGGSSVTQIESFVNCTVITSCHSIATCTPTHCSVTPPIMWLCMYVFKLWILNFTFYILLYMNTKINI